MGCIRVFNPITGEYLRTIARGITRPYWLAHDSHGLIAVAECNIPSSQWHVYRGDGTHLHTGSIGQHTLLPMGTSQSTVLPVGYYSSSTDNGIALYTDPGSGWTRVNTLYQNRGFVTRKYIPWLDLYQDTLDIAPDATGGWYRLLNNYVTHYNSAGQQLQTRQVQPAPFGWATVGMSRYHKTGQLCLLSVPTEQYTGQAPRLLVLDADLTINASRAINWYELNVTGIDDGADWCCPPAFGNGAGYIGNGTIPLYVVAPDRVVVLDGVVQVGEMRLPGAWEPKRCIYNRVDGLLYVADWSEEEDIAVHIHTTAHLGRVHKVTYDQGSVTYQHAGELEMAWSDPVTVTAYTEQVFPSIHVSSTGKLFIVGKNQVVYSTDGGDTWR